MATVLEEDSRHCWICYACEIDDPGAHWVNPCRCKGTAKWSHQACIQRWIDEKQKGAHSSPVKCPQCGTPYTISFPPVPYIVGILDSCDEFVQYICPMVTAGICTTSVYWCCVTYGAVTIMQCTGHEWGLKFIGKCDPIFLLVALPLVPVGLFMGKMIHWHEPVIKFLRYFVPKVPLCRYILPTFDEVPTPSSSALHLPEPSSVSITRALVGAFFFPTISTLLGQVLYGQLETSHLKRTILGGITYVGAKGVLKIYHQQYMFIRRKQRVVLNFVEKNSVKPRD